MGRGRHFSDLRHTSIKRAVKHTVNAVFGQTAGKNQAGVLLSSHRRTVVRHSTVRKLRDLADDSVVGETPVQKSLRPKIGTRYVREHAGKLHQVTVLEAGYEYEGTTYRSLSEIACAITGTKWSGPAFFGLKRRARSAAA